MPSSTATRFMFSRNANTIPSSVWKPRNGEKQLVVVARRKRLEEGVLASRLEMRARRGVDRQRVGVDHDADTARVGDAVRAIGEAVTEIDAGGRGAVSGEHEPETDAWLG